ncbi:MAG TPA: hypothetical protein VLE96_00920 [Chlamydiales bacterium]|nr:hypothetical protein [Chlamydiales bacterium]
MSISCRIGDKNYTIPSNANSSKSNSALISNYLESAEGGPFRFNQLCDKICALIVSLDVNHSEYFKNAAGILRSGWSMTILPGLPGFFARAYGAISELAKATVAIPGAFGRKVLNAIQETATCVSAVAYASAPFVSIAKDSETVSKKILKGAGVATIVADTCDLVKNGQDAFSARTLANRVEKLPGVSPEFKEAVSTTQTFHILKVMKSVCSVSSFICGLSFLSACFSGVPARAVIAATVSLAGTMLSIGSSLYEKGMKYERIKFYSEKHVQQIVRQPEPQVQKMSTQL